jgi:ABC-type transport system involved in multi-copper enzyme maturation permease subunit
MSAPSTWCLVRGELRKVVRQRSTWALPPAAAAVGWAAAAVAADQAARLGHFEAAIDTYRAFAAAAVGTILLVVSARLVATEYQEGTIRVVLARGTGRLRLLFAKLAAVGVLALPLLATVAVAGLVYLAFVVQQPRAAVAWRDVWVAALTVALSAAACGLLGAAAGAVGRSMAFALAVAGGFFPVDNGLGLVLPLLHTATQERVWGAASSYLLGPTLNHLPSVLMGRPAGELVPPELPVGAAHSLLVVAAYLAVFAGAAVAGTRFRDVLE